MPTSLTWCRGSCTATQCCWHTRRGSEHKGTLQRSSSPRRRPAPAPPSRHRSTPRSCTDGAETQPFRGACHRGSGSRIKTHHLLPRAPLQYRRYGSHQMGDASNSDSSGEQFPHVDERLFARAAASPSRLSRGQETAAGNLRNKSPVFPRHLRIQVPGRHVDT